MPYNTRRKSLSLPSLGIHIPVQRSSITANNTQSNTNMSSKQRLASESLPRVSKKLKRSHDDSPSSTVASVPNSKATVSSAKCDPTPPPSPGVHSSIETDESDLSSLPEVKPVDLEGINDEIVEAVIVRLQETRNRPQLVKDLAAVLMEKVAIVQQSANPCAIISSRLATFMKRSGWTASAPCPLTKELETVHPRRTYFYLTTCPHLPLPDPYAVQRSAIVTPSLSSSGSTTEDTDADRRRELSLSPEVDLSSPEFEDMEEGSQSPVPGSSVGSVSSRHRPVYSLSRIHKSEEPPLEKEEKEFTQTADGLQQLRASGGLLSATPADQLGIDDGMQHEQLFGEPHRTFFPSFIPYMAFMTSPAMRPTLTIPAPMKRDGEAEGWSKLDAMLDWDKSPETIELDELDGLLDDF
ncbi:hypothetical protein GGS20DRAFT_575827 [Poronia punctata]|nr:hypothetical protein GGS20DRAFT_575827 [Poronia punctata]